MAGKDEVVIVVTLSVGRLVVVVVGASVVVFGSAVVTFALLSILIG